MHQLDSSLWRLGTLLLITLVALGRPSSALADASQALIIFKGEDQHTLSRNEIESLGLHEVTMQHPEGPKGRFSGVWLDALFKQQELDEAPRVRFIAEDGYTTFLTPQERRDKRYLLVTRLNGAPVTQENLGPYMLIVPDDAKAALDGDVSITRWIWAVRKIQAR